MSSCSGISVEAKIKKLLLTVFIEPPFWQLNHFEFWTGLIIDNLTFVNKQLVLLSFSIYSVEGVSWTPKTAKTRFCWQVICFKAELDHLVYPSIYLLTSNQNFTWFLRLFIVYGFSERVSNSSKDLSNACGNGSDKLWRVALMKNLNFQILTN